MPLLLALALHTPCGTWIERLEPPAPSPIVVPTCVARPMRPGESCDRATVTQLLGLPALGPLVTRQEILGVAWTPPMRDPPSAVACVVATGTRLEWWIVSADGGPCLASCRIAGSPVVSW